MRALAWDLDTYILDIPTIADAVGTSTTLVISSHDLLLHAAVTTASSSTKHPHFSALAARLFIASIHKITRKTFSTWVSAHGEAHTGLTGAFNTDFVLLVQHYSAQLDNAIVHSRDFMFTYHVAHPRRARTLANTYLLRRDGCIIERPQFMYMRVALAAHGYNLEM
ncbi:hypothetical protein K466DRAFT_570979, partial [Polyporus arcularius HHB13444]